jgi:pimeloyl-ACP methyl ester carboxylesterase
MRRYPAVLTLAIALLLVAVAPASAKFSRGPAGDAFYTPPSPLPAGKHGDVIWARKLSGEAALKSAGANWLVLYRSVGTDGKPIAVSGTVSLPKGKAPKRGWPVISFDHGTTGIADQCAPSRDSAGNPAHLYISYVYPLLNRWLKAGYAVVRTDYQGLGTPGVHQYLVGVAEGRSTLDIARAARQIDFVKHRVSNRIAIAGHSQGGHAALWGAFLARKYTPDLKLHGTVAFAPASHLSELLSLVSSVKTPGGGLSAEAGLVIRGVDDAKPDLGVQSIFTDKLAALYPQVDDKCLPQLGQSDSLGGLAPSEFFKDGADTTPFVKALDLSDPENLTIKSPLDIEQGESDTTVLPGLTDSLVKDLRGRGSKIVYKTYKGVGHGDVVVAGADHSTAYIKKRLK